MKYIFKIVALVLTSLVALTVLVSTAQAGGPWSDQYCDVSHETVITKNEKGEIIDQVTKEKVKCEDGVMDFLKPKGFVTEHDKRPDGSFEVKYESYG